MFVSFLEDFARGSVDEIKLKHFLRKHGYFVIMSVIGVLHIGNCFWKKKKKIEQLKVF